MLTKDQIKANERAGTPVEIDAWGGEVRLRALSVAEAARLAKGEKDVDPDADELEEDGFTYLCRVVSTCLVEPELSPEDLRELSTAGLRQCFDKVQLLSAGESVDEVKGNS